MSSNGKTDIQSVKSAWSILYLELKAHALPTIRGNNKGRKINKHTHTYPFQISSVNSIMLTAYCEVFKMVKMTILVIY